MVHNVLGISMLDKHVLTINIIIYIESEMGNKESTQLDKYYTLEMIASTEESRYR